MQELKANLGNVMKSPSRNEGRRKGGERKKPKGRKEGMEKGRKERNQKNHQTSMA
jgi:flagellar biosynthesis/type III secretory pathway protein FliH